MSRVGAPPRAGSRTSLVAGLLLALAAGCGGETGFSGPDDGDDGPDLRPGLTVKVEAGPEAAEIAQAFGWTEGIPGAEVRIHRWGTEFAWRTAVTGADGVVNFPDVISGTYRVAVVRTLTDAEAAALGGRRRALASGRAVEVAERTRTTLQPRPDADGGLVIAEVYGTSPFVRETTYEFHHFLEVYNNSAETVFLDGKLIGKSWGRNLGSESTVPCDISRPFMDDPLGVWAIYLQRFPGSGSEHPLGPGETAVVALDAFDHSTIADPRMPDLSDADFEFLGSSDADNPRVPNMPEVGLRSWFEGHGMRFFVGAALYLVEPVDVATLERAVLQDPRGGDIEFVRIPREALIDVVATDDDDALEEQRFDRCSSGAHRDFDSLEGGFTKHGQDLEFSVQRRVIAVVDGRKILQDTNTSAVDLVRGRYTPGTQLEP